MTPLIRICRLLLLPAILVASAWSACLPVSGDRILARDLALADRRFSALPSTLPIGYAPVAGASRIFAALELQHIARANGISLTDPSEICFEVPMHVPADTEFTEPMHRTLPVNTDVRILDMSHAAIPAGRIEFPLTGLEPSASGGDGAQLWRGFVQYTDTRRITVWARVSVSTTYAAVIAVKDLLAGIPIDASALRLENKTGSLNHAPGPARIEDVAGRVLQRPLKSGSEILLSFLDDPPAIRRGDSVRVEVRSGLAVLHFDAVAQNNARAGDIAELRNPITGKLFRARIAPTGSKAIIVVGSGPTL